MGLLGKLMGAKPAKAPTDDVLLLHSIFCIAAADGSIEDSEDEMIRAYANTLPEFRDMDGNEFNKAMEAAKHVYGSARNGKPAATNSMIHDVWNEIARVAGWLSHWLEQLQGNRIYRLEQVYVGKNNVAYVPLAQRA